MKKTLCTIIVTLCMLISISSTAFALEVMPSVTAPEDSDALDLSESAVYERMMALEEIYPTGTRWTNNNIYYGITRESEFKTRIGQGCAGFAFMLTDAGFGRLATYVHEDFDKIRVGDHIRIDNEHGDEHSVVILSITDEKVIIAEGNISGKVRWGREYTLKKFKSVFLYALTRYPDPSKETKVVSAPTPTANPAPAPTVTAQPAPVTNTASAPVQSTTVTAKAQFTTSNSTPSTPSHNSSQNSSAISDPLKVLVVNNHIVRDRIQYSFSLGTAYSNGNTSTSESMSGNFQNVVQYSKAAGSNDIIIKYKGQTHIVKPNTSAWI